MSVQERRGGVKCNVDGRKRVEGNGEVEQRGIQRKWAIGIVREGGEEKSMATRESELWRDNVCVSDRAGGEREGVWSIT